MRFAVLVVVVAAGNKSWYSVVLGGMMVVHLVLFLGLILLSIPGRLRGDHHLRSRRYWYSLNPMPVTCAPLSIVLGMSL